MNKPHKHADLIKAWADGADIERHCARFNKWEPLSKYPAWNENISYRIKPKEPIVKTMQIGRSLSGAWLMYSAGEGRDNVRFTFDPDTNELLSVEKI